jgi:hypothetical protein
VEDVSASATESVLDVEEIDVRRFLEQTRFRRREAAG